MILQCILMKGVLWVTNADILFFDAEL